MPTQLKILFATDFAQQCYHASEYAAYFAKQLNAELVLLHVLEESSMVRKMFTSDEQTIQINNKLQELLSEKVDLLKAQGVKHISTQVAYGKVYEKITEIASQTDPVCIIMGRSEDTLLKKSFIGSNAWRVIENTEFPVITIRGDKSPVADAENRDILLPLDFTKQVKGQVGVAIAFAKYLKAKINILSVQTEDSAGLEVKLLTEMNKTQKAIEKEGLVCHAHLVKEFNRAVFDVVAEHTTENTRLVVVMTQQKGSFVDHFVGSSAKAFIEKMDIPVLSVNPWEYESEETVMNYFVDPLGVF